MSRARSGDEASAVLLLRISELPPSREREGADLQQCLTVVLCEAHFLYDHLGWGQDAETRLPKTHRSAELPASTSLKTLRVEAAFMYNMHSSTAATLMGCSMTADALSHARLFKHQLKPFL